MRIIRVQRNTAILMASLKEKSTRKEFIQDIVILILFGVKPLFPFGYGLSYTEMQIRFHGMKTSGDGVEVEAEVTNTGETFSGKEVVQVYVSLPQDESGKEYRRLAGFAKTKLLKPGEKELLKIGIDRKTLAYFFRKSSMPGLLKKVIMLSGSETALHRLRWLQCLKCRRV